MRCCLMNNAGKRDTDMKIVIATDAWRPQVNGVVTTYQETVKCLKHYGHQVLLITPEQFFSIPCPTYREIPLSLFPGRKIDKILREFGPDAVHIATEGPIGWAIRSWCLKNGTGFTTSYHTRFPEYIRMRAPVPLIFSYMVVKRFHSKALRTMVATEVLKSELEARGFRNLFIWSRGVDLSTFRPWGKDFIKGPRPVLMYVGRVAVEKNIEAFLCLDTPGTKFVVGDGPARKKLERKYPDVHFAGVKRGRELALYMAASDVFVFPSLTDTFGIVMIEAAGCGVPVAAYPVTGPNQIIKEGINGALDTNLRNAVDRALRLDGAICRTTALKYSWHECTRRFVSNLHVLNRNATHVFDADRRMEIA